MYLRKSKNIIFIIFLILVFLWGGFFDFAAALYGCVFAVSLCMLCLKREKLQILKGITFYGGILLIVCTVISHIAAADKGVASIGVIRMAVLAVFWVLWNNMKREYQEQAFDAVPLAGTFVNIVALVSWFVPGMKDCFFSAGRLWGTFQYSNTWAMFLLMGMVVIAFKPVLKKYDWVQLGVLLTGIVMTGSRSVFVMTVLFGVMAFVRGRIGKKEKILVIAGTMLAILILQSAMHLDIGRLAELSLNSSTLNGRFLYWQDAFPLLLQHPFGLGYMGYYFMQPQIQTGYYFTKFVHNDLLQCALDMGIAAALIMIVMVAASLLAQGNSKRNRWMLLLVALHGLFDFDMQFIIMPCIVIMCMYHEGKKILEIKKDMVLGIAGIAGCFFVYFAVALFLDYKGDEQLSLSMYSGNTLAREELLLSEDKKEAFAAARKIISDNGMIAASYEIALQEAFEVGDYKMALEYEDKMLQCAGYELYYYNQAVYRLSFVLDEEVRSGDLEAAQAILEEIQSMPERLEELKNRTTTLAWKIYDKPSFALNQEIEDYINQLTGITLEE